jgi:hypothetical protein
MACKRSAVRARLAPLVRSLIRKTRTASTAGRYSNGGRWAAVRVFGSHVPPAGLLAGQRIPGAEPTTVSLSPGQIPPHRSGDFCRLATTPPSRRAIPASGCCRTCKWSGRAGRPGRCDSLPGAAPAAQGGAFADGRRGARAQRVAPMVSGRRWARWCAAPLTHRVALWRSACAHAGTLARHVRNQAPRGARDVAGRQVACPGTLTLAMPDDRHRRWLDGGASPHPLCDARASPRVAEHPTSKRGHITRIKLVLLTARN